MVGPTKHWYGSCSTAQPRGVVQMESHLKDRYVRLTLPEHILRLAQAEYEHHFGHEQDYERMQERGGLGLLEVVGLLADLADHLGAQPTKPRSLEPSERCPNCKPCEECLRVLGHWGCPDCYPCEVHAPSRFGDE